MKDERGQEHLVGTDLLMYSRKSENPLQSQLNSIINEINDVINDSCIQGSWENKNT